MATVTKKKNKVKKIKIDTGSISSEFTSSREGIVELVGSKIDNAYYISTLISSTQKSKEASRISIGSVTTPSEKQYYLSVINSGVPPTDGIGDSILYIGKFLTEDRENELHFDSLSYFELDGANIKGEKFSKVFYTIADSIKFVSESHEKGDL